MRARIMKLAAGTVAVGALATGGATLASASSKAPPVTPPVATAAPVDGDTLQQGDQTAPDSGTAAEQSSESSSSEQAGESSSEAAANDGPGGHADEPGNPNADNQFQGEQ